ncbi:MAG: M28 family peptidase [Elusimicrobia bacterium]|nr:M28 family peptidase [Elusimicrobiota bacterium]
MKKIVLFLLAIMLYSNIQAQITPPPTYRQKGDLKIQKSRYALQVGGGVIHHDLEVELKLSSSFIKAEDTIELPKHIKEVLFTLHKDLNPVSLTKGAKIEKIKENSSSETNIFETFKLTSPREIKKFRVSYEGKIHHPLQEEAQEYSRSFSQTPGIISKEGCYLSGSSFWYPRIKDKLITFKLTAKLPKNYSLISGGERLNKSESKTIWQSKEPLDDIILSCGKFTEYSLTDKKIEYYAFLRNPDKLLAEKYLNTAKRYANMYSELIGQYPYKKFAMVENFWETGYGMPSFTLLGPTVIRLPFILNSSYPHEILHNWWGNSVFVDYPKGNWCEGITVYLADYLIKEQQGKAKEYRMSALQKYADYVKKAKDFPLTDFRSRHSSASEAVGYGKAMMFFHMLRLKLGDKLFIDGLRHFYKENKFKHAAFKNLQESFEKVSDKNLEKFFTQWVQKSGAPEIKCSKVTLSERDHKFVLYFALSQIEKNSYDLDIPVVARFKNSEKPFQTVLNLNRRSKFFKLELDEKPISFEIDPEFDVFRKISPQETPSTLSRILGAKKPLIILPSKAESDKLEKYKEFALLWTKDETNLPEIKMDSEISSLPENRAFWLIGKENMFFENYSKIMETLNAKLNEKAFVYENAEFELKDKTLVFSAMNPANDNFSAGFILADSPDKLKSLARKLPHYGKYSYLVFDKDMTNIKTGLWDIVNSPLTAVFETDGDKKYYAKSKLKNRKALIYPPSDFSEKNLRETVEFLSKKLKGRGPNSPQKEKAADYIAKEFEKFSIKPLNNESYFQKWQCDINGEETSLKNIIGKIEGYDKKLKNEYVIVGAHYDHLKTKNEKIYPGADDNASGIALMLELARFYSEHKTARTLIFVAFDGEEDGRIGSKYFLKTLEKTELKEINAMINIDSIGRLGSKKILILNSESSPQWKHIFTGAGFETGIGIENINKELDSSDQISFCEKNIPAVQIFSGAHEDYHKPSDTLEKIDFKGIVKTGELLREVLNYLASDSPFLTKLEERHSEKQPLIKTIGKRTVSTGLVPSFSWQGKGIKIDSITQGSSLSKTEIKQGDIIVKINDRTIEGLREYAEELAKRKPNDKVKITYISNNETKTTEIILQEK